MKFLECREIPDEDNLWSLAENSRLNSYPSLRNKFAGIMSSYAEYLRIKGNASKRQTLTSLQLSEALKKALIGHYSSPPNSLEPFLNTLRDKGSPDVCPMCGSFGTGTLDHVFPKNDFPQFSIFSKNLVPACICNTHRKEVLVGVDNAKRILHPYFDRILTRRIVRAHILPSPDFEEPSITLKVLTSEGDSDHEAVCFHIENVLRKNRIYAYFDDAWSKLTKNPELYLGTRRKRRISESILQRSVKSLLKDTDDDFGTPNNWKSMLLSGIVENRAAQLFFLQKIRSLRRQGLDSEDLSPN